ncbi:MFS transporter [Heyndrickxia oleronia]
MDTDVLRKKDDYVKTKSKIPYWWKVVLAFSLGWMFINANKYFLNPILDNIGLEYHLNNSQLGLVNSIFFLTYTIAQIPAGSFSDKFGRKKLLVIGFILYGVLTGISGLMAGFTGFLVARAVAGLASATYYGPQFALSSEAIPAKNRTVGSAIINSGSGIGIALGFILSSTLVLDMGMSWRIPFYIF